MFTADHVLLNCSKSTRSLACKRVLLKCDSVNKELCIRHSWTYLWGITYNLLGTNVQLPHLPWKENQSHRWGMRVEGNSSCLKKTKQSTLHMLEVSHALHAVCNSIADTNTTGIWPKERVTCRPNNKQAFWQQRFNAHHTHSYLRAMGLKKRFSNRERFPGKKKSTSDNYYVRSTKVCSLAFIACAENSLLRHSWKCRNAVFLSVRSRNQALNLFWRSHKIPTEGNHSV